MIEFNTHVTLEKLMFSNDLIFLIGKQKHKLKIEENRLLCTLLCTNAITLFPKIYVRTYSHINKLLINHELIHWFQQLKYKELGFNYYKDYILESINPFHRNLFEIEAYDNEYDFLFLLGLCVNAPDLYSDKHVSQKTLFCFSSSATCFLTRLLLTSF